MASIVRFCAGLMVVWDREWIYRYGNPTRRDMIVGAVFDWDRTIVDEADPVAKLKREGEEQQRKRYEEAERGSAIKTKSYELPISSDRKSGGTRAGRPRQPSKRISSCMT